MLGAKCLAYFLAQQENIAKLINLSYIFPAKQEISEAYTNVPAKTNVDYFISMSFCLSVVLWHNFVCGSVREL